jgi:ATP-dependent Clp protease protease subunit
MPTPELLIDADIGGGWFYEGITAKSVNAFLKANTKAEEIKVRINSVGGDVFEGVAIYNALSKCSARIVVDVEGVAASAASVIAMAGDEIRVCKGAMIMIHEAAGVAFGTAQEHESTAVLLRKINDEAADIYAARTGQDREKLLQLMDETTWMGAEEAKSLGFCDAIVPAKEKPATAKPSKATAKLMAGFKKVPEAFQASMRLLMSAGLTHDESSAERAGEVIDMNEQEILKALGVSSVAEGVQRLSLLARIEAKTGKAGDEAQGLVLAALASHAELPKLQARIAELEENTESQALESLILKAKEDKKCTPAMAESVRASFKAKEITLKGAEAWLSNSPTVAALQTKQETPAAPSTTVTASGDTWNGKGWDDLTPVLRAQLKRENPELYKAMRRPA